MTKSLTLMLMLWPFFGCKVNNGGAKNDQGKTGLATVQNNVQQDTLLSDLKNLPEEHLDFDAEFKKFMAAIDEFQKSGDYANAVTEEQRLLAQLADAAALIPSEVVKKMVLEKKFQLLGPALDNAASNADQAWQLLKTTDLLTEATDADNPPSLQDLKDVATGFPVLKQGEVGASGSEGKGESGGSGHGGSDPKLVSSAYFLVGLGALGLVHHAYELYSHHKKGTFFLREGYFDRPGNAFISFGVFGKFALFLYAGAMALQAVQDGDTEGAVAKIEEGFYVFGALAAAVSLYYTFEVLVNTTPAGKKVLTTALTPVGSTETRYNPKAFYGLRIIDMILGGRGNFAPKVKGETVLIKRGDKSRFIGFENAKGVEIKDWKYEGKTTAIIQGGAKAAVAAAIAVGAIAWGHTLSLADETSSSSKVFLLRAARFYNACELLSRRGVLVLN